MSPLQSVQCRGTLPHDVDYHSSTLELSGVPEARYSKLLNSNDPPLEIEGPSIKSLISRLHRRLSQYDDKISLLRAQLERLVQERATTESDLSRTTAIISPLRRMPPEILSEIFALTLPSDEEVVKRGAIDVRGSPWILTHICGRWRMVALASSSLWSFFGIDCDVRSNTAAAYPLPLLSAQLRRANRLRIDFLASSPSQYQLAVLKLLVDHSHRWEELDLFVVPEILPIIKTLPGRIPVLHTLKLQWDDPDAEEDLESDGLDFSDAPALRNVSFMTEERILAVPLPAHQLTRYQLAGTWQRHIEILMVAKNLVEARIFVVDKRTPRMVPDGVIELRDLRRLYVSDADILDYLRVPALQVLGFYQEESGFDPSRHIHSAASRSSCILRKLCAYGFPDADIITGILRQHQAIVELVVIITEDPEYDPLEGEAAGINALISRLSAHNSDGIFDVAPYLSGLFFGSHIDSGINYERFHCMLLSRWQAGALKSAGLVATHVEREPPPSIRCRLDDLRADGLDLLCMHGDDAEKVIHGLTS